MNNDNKVETAIAGLNFWASYATGAHALVTLRLIIVFAWH